MAMVLGGYTFPVNPSSIDGMFTKVRSTAYMQTYSSCAFFSWGVFIAGKTIPLDWDYMPRTMFDALQTLLESDDTLGFDPDLENGKTYTVEILSLNGKYYLTQGNTIDTEVAYRKDVKLELLIMSEVT